MTTLVFLAVIGAAFLHAAWNALVKGGADKLMSLTAVILGHVPFALVAIVVSPMPDPASYPYLVVGVLLHLGYQFFLLYAYSAGDLTQVYPIARGSAPLIVAAISVTVLGVSLQGAELLAVLIIGCGIVSLALVRRSDGLRNGRAAGFALATGCFIAAYSIVDGLGARAAGTALGYFGWLAALNAIALGAIVAVRAPKTYTSLWTKGQKLFWIGGGASFAAYAIVTWAFTQAPIALVTALRETSIIFALLIGVFFLKERLDLMKVVSTMTVLIGAALLRLSRP
ncbi:DMT family transporter [Yoonia litorea]|uniref:EamA-like transporter family protein n=1 Tax=Yoonia litorea TaxID=1123755 RepID=A0A1I6LFD3_9RHOB|nr:DMT family transporter [Yoonia litorea]SFS02162.1 EamA-like transporter family protein [Yoonia litorea]